MCAKVGTRLFHETVSQNWATEFKFRLNSFYCIHRSHLITKLYYVLVLYMLDVNKFYVCILTLINSKIIIKKTTIELRTQNVFYRTTPSNRRQIQSVSIGFFLKSVNVCNTKSKTRRVMYFLFFFQ